MAIRMPLTAQTQQLLRAARELYKPLGAEAILFISEVSLPWNDVADALKGCRVIIAPQSQALAQQLSGRDEFIVLSVEPRPIPMRERISLALLESLTHEHLRSGSVVIGIYNGIEVEDDADQLDTISIIHLGENLERLSAKELRKLDTAVPIETLKAVIDLATEIGREGREGKPVGTIFVVGDTRKVLSLSRMLGFDPVRGYSKKERDIRDRRVRESMKEIAKLDGAVIVHEDGTVVAAARYIDVLADGITLSKGLGSRHWTAAAVSKRTKAIAIAVSESTGIVRVFQNGEVMLHLAPYSRPILWRSISESDDEAGTNLA